MSEKSKAFIVLTMNTLAFTVCFACWMMNGVLITFLVENGLYDWDKAQMGWLIGIPVLSGSLVRLPVGIWTDKYGGRIVYALLMLFSAVAMYLMSYADSYWQFFFAGLGFGVVGASFAVGIAYTSVWFSKDRQGLALGIFGAGNAGAAFTLFFAPSILSYLTDYGRYLEGWRNLPKVYALMLVVMALLFFSFTYYKKVNEKVGKTLRERLAPLKSIRVWRFGLYYFLVFGGFVALSQWLVPYYVTVYEVSLAFAGFLAGTFSLPSGVIRALGGWMSDYWGARRVMYWTLGTCTICSLLLIFPRMDVFSPGQGTIAWRGGLVKSVSSTEIVIGKDHYPIKRKEKEIMKEGMLMLPTQNTWQEPKVVVGEKVVKKQLIAKGVTHIYFQANIWIFAIIVFIIGTWMGIGKAAVYKHIPDYFPTEVGVVGGLVGVLGGLGGFFCPIIFGYLVKCTGLWTTCWMFLLVLSLGCLIWMHIVIQRMMRKKTPELMRKIEGEGKQPQIDPFIAQ